MPSSKTGPGDPSVQSSLKNLSIGTPKAKADTKTAAVAESWEDSDEDTPEDEEGGGLSTPKASPRRPRTSEYPGPPPPTPASPRFVQDFQDPRYQDGLDSFNRRPSRLEREGASAESGSRPEKTISTASRMIAAGLGVKAPPKTEEQKQYDRAMRDKERKAKDVEKESKRKAEESKAKAKQAMWDD